MYKARAYKNAAGIIAKLPYEVTDGISCAKRTKGIGPSIAAKIEDWKPLGAFPAKEAFRAYTQVNTAQSRQEFFPVQHL